MATKISNELFSWVPSEREQFKCKGCAVCGAKGCIGQLPGMGGVNCSSTFSLNCLAWDDFYNKSSCSVQSQIDSIKVSPDQIAVAPVTGANQNIGFANEKDFYLPYFGAALESGIGICVGDGAPDEKLQFGYEAVCSLNTKAYYFFKPYPDDILQKRISLVKDTAMAIGMDIDAYNIITMRNQVCLEYKTGEQIKAFRESSGLPLMLKGIFSERDVGLCSDTKPDICVVSNHGGRVDTQNMSSLEFLLKNAEALSMSCGEVWVDGGIRTKRHIQTALYLGASKVLIARGFISRLIKGGVKSMVEYAASLYN